jgi:hypothetical protein
MRHGSRSYNGLQCTGISVNGRRLSSRGRVVTRRSIAACGAGLLTGFLRGQSQRGFQTAELRAGEIALVLGNEYDHGAGRAGYIGIWSLTSVHEPTNVFVPHYAGWISRRHRATVSRAAWDWRVTVTQGVQTGVEVNFPVRAVYKKYVSDADVLDEYARWISSR